MCGRTGLDGLLSSGTAIEKPTKPTALRMSRLLVISQLTRDTRVAPPQQTARGATVARIQVVRAVDVAWPTRRLSSPHTNVTACLGSRVGVDDASVSMAPSFAL